MIGVYRDKLDSCKKELENINSIIKKEPLSDSVKYLTSYAVVLATGCIELVFKEMLFDAVSAGCSDEAKCFLNNQIIESSCNPTVKKINDYLSKMGTDCKKSFSLIEKSNDASRLQSLVNLRNSFALGYQISASISDVIEYFVSGSIILSNLERILFNKKETNEL